MPEWLAVVPANGEVPADVLAWRLSLSAVFGVVVAAVYFFTQRKQRTEAAPFVTTLVLLSILLAMVSLVIGSNIARAFSLVGALAIVRFRTVVEDTRDTAFVIFAVITGMAVGAGVITVPLIGIPIVTATAWALTVWGGNGTERTGPGKLVVRLGIGADPGGAVAEVLSRHLADSRLVSVATARQGAAMDLTYSGRLREGTTALTMLAELQRVEGVQAVEWGETPKG